MAESQHARYLNGTFLYKLFNDLLEYGFFEGQAYEVMDSFIEGEYVQQSAMCQRWCEDPSSYPDMIYHLQWRLLQTYALQYIDNHTPNAWFRPCFLAPDAQEKWLEENGAKNV
jgi:hypothetical protein